MEGDQQKQKTKVWETFAGGCRGMALSVPRGHSLPNFVFFVFLVTFHGFLLVLSPSCMVLFVFLVTFHVFLLIVEAGGRAAWLAGHAGLAVWLVGQLCRLGGPATRQHMVWDRRPHII